MKNNYEHALAVNTESGNMYDPDVEGKALVSAIVEYAASDLFRAIYRDILMGEFSSGYTVSKVEHIATMHKRLELKKIVNHNDIPALRKTWSNAEHDTVDEIMRTKPLISWFAMMGSHNSLYDYIFRKIVNTALEDVNIMPDYKEQAISFYEKEVKRFG